jgi:hypothetical protein
MPPIRSDTWQHVENDGVLCLLPNMAEVDADDPSAGLWCKRRRPGRFTSRGMTQGKLTAVLSVDDLFKGCHFDQEIIVLCATYNKLRR